MKLGFITAICGEMTFEEVVDFAAAHGFACLEAASWPQGKAERRYAGVSHIDAERVLADAGYAERVAGYAAGRGVAISALAYYPNTLDPDPARRSAAVEHLKNVIRAAARLGVGMVTTFIGRDQHKTVEENLALAGEIWPPILRLAEEQNVKIAIENCPMLFDADQWPGGQNLMTSPANWRKIFAILDSPQLGINYDPSHFVWQQIDYIRPLYAFRDKIFHVHCKDIKLYPDKLAEVGVMGYPLSYMSPKLPGLGDVDWGRYISALTDIGYDGYVCIEVEDKAYENGMEGAKRALLQSQRYLQNYLS